MKISKNILIGLILNGLLGYFDDKEIQSDTNLKKIAHGLNTKLSVFRNGSKSFNKRLKISLLKKKKNKRDLEYIEKFKQTNEKYDVHNMISSTVWKRAQKKISKSEITTTDLIVWIFKSNESARKFFGFSEEFLKVFAYSSPHKGKHTFSSIKVGNVLHKIIDEEVAHYYYKLEKDLHEKK